jgi:hypothetical protein
MTRTETFFVAIWERPSGPGAIKRRCGESENYPNEDQLRQECRERQSIPDVVIEMRREGFGKWSAVPYTIEERDVT